jgi:hypothetical protein
MNTLLLSTALISAALVSPGSAFEEPAARHTPGSEFLVYESNAAFSTVAKQRVAIWPDGFGSITSTRRVVDEQNRKDPPQFRILETTSELSLNDSEMEAIRGVIRRVDFFSLPDQIPAQGPAHGSAFLLVREGQRSHSVTFGSDRRLSPIVGLIGGFTRQQQLEEMLKSGAKGAGWNAFTALMSGTQPPYGLARPEELRAPLQGYLWRAEDEHDVVMGVAALAQVSTSLEFAGFLSATMERASGARRDWMLTGAAGVGPTPDQRRTIDPILIYELKRVRANWATLSTKERAPYAAVAMRLAEDRAWDALPAMVELLTASPDDPEMVMTAGLARFGTEAANYLTPMLVSVDPSVRSAAMRVYTRVLEERRSADEHSTYGARVFREKWVPLLLRMKKDDPKPSLRQQAAVLLRLGESQPGPGRNRP